MILPYCAQATVPPAKLIGYLLSASHPVGRTKAAFFRAHGFTEADAALLAERLLVLACTAQVAATVATPFGLKYIIDGSLLTPAGNPLQLRTIWIMEAGQFTPRFVTAYPAPATGEEKSND
jgi:hypothetical protein